MNDVYQIDMFLFLEVFIEHLKKKSFATIL